MQKEYQNPFTIGRIKNVKGDFSRPVSSDNRTIVLFVPTTGEFDYIKGNSTVDKVYPKAKELYRQWWRSQRDFKPGNIKLNQVRSDTELAHLITCVEENGEVGFTEEALTKTIETLGKKNAVSKKSVHINKCGTEDEWNVIMNLLEKFVARRGVNIFIYS